MSRVLKFRAWDHFYGHFIYSDECANLAEFWAKVQGGIDAGREVPVQEFTGLTDAKGKEIWEGDIVKRDLDGDTGIVEMDDGVYTMSGDCQLPLWQETVEIIGNVYEHPSLLSDTSSKK